MKQANTVISHGFAGFGMAAAVALGLLLSGCGQAVKKPPAPPVQAAATGVPACDNYLNSYLSCHGAAGIYPPQTLQTHYQAMRETLLQEAADPRTRPYLANRCLGLAQQLHEALQGRSCNAAQSAGARQDLGQSSRPQVQRQ
jgi:hypothetical protein